MEDSGKYQALILPLPLVFRVAGLIFSVVTDDQIGSYAECREA